MINGVMSKPSVCQARRGRLGKLREDSTFIHLKRPRTPSRAARPCPDGGSAVVRPPGGSVAMVMTRTSLCGKGTGERGRSLESRCHPSKVGVTSATALVLVRRIHACHEVGFRGPREKCRCRVGTLGTATPDRYRSGTDPTGPSAAQNEGRISRRGRLDERRLKIACAAPSLDMRGRSAGGGPMHGCGPGSCPEPRHPSSVTSESSWRSPSTRTSRSAASSLSRRRGRRFASGPIAPGR